MLKTKSDQEISSSINNSSCQLELSAPSRPHVGKPLQSKSNPRRRCGRLGLSGIDVLYLTAQINIH